MIQFKNVKTAGDLIIKELAPFDAYTRADVSVVLTGAQKLTIGTPVSRVGTGTYAPVVAALAEGAEVAIYLADKTGIFMDTAGAGTHIVAGIVRGPIQLKDKTIRDAMIANGFTPTDVQFKAVVDQAAKQGIIVEKVLG